MHESSYPVPSLRTLVSCTIDSSADDQCRRTVYVVRNLVLCVSAMPLIAVCPCLMASADVACVSLGFLCTAFCRLCLVDLALYLSQVSVSSRLG